ncbi:MAG: helix-turn-helix transcriptional regulator, partial [Actinobacteria bacterium]|nr:helix-turn-helix transcriptional regulator [Actinomycetota bacterium]
MRAGLTERLAQLRRDVPARQEGVDGLRALGWSPAPGAVPWLEADVLSGVDWTVGRAWTAGVLSRAPERTVGALHVFVGVEGRGSIVVGDEEITVADRQVVIVDADRDTQLSSVAPWARLEWVLVAPALVLSRTLQPHAPVVVHDLHWDMIAAMTNTLVGREPAGPVADSLPPLDGIGHVLGQLLLVALGDADLLAQPQGSPTAEVLMLRARTLIAENFADPAYAVRDLRRDLALSNTHLHRLFADQGTTPRRELEARR